AEQLSLGRKVALKVLDPSLSDLPHIRERFRREAQAAARLQHPHVCQPIDFGVDEAAGTAWFAMELLEGGSVSDRLDRGQPFEEAEALRVVRDVARALVYAAEQGLVHRDIKPQNILFDLHGTTKL